MSSRTDLRQQIEDLALRTVLENETPEQDAKAPASEGSMWVSAIDAIGKQAAEQGAAAITAIACTLTDAIHRCPPAGRNGVLQDGIARLQEALEMLDRPEPAASSSLGQDIELLSDFVLETREHLASMEGQVLTLEKDPCNAEALHSVFRSFHTIKGLAGFLELWEVQKLSHEVETLLDQARNLQLTLTAPAIDVILESADYLRRWLVHLESTLQNLPSQAPARDENLLQRVAAIANSHSAEAGRQSLAELAAVVESGGETPAPPPEAAVESKRRETMAIKVDTAKLDYLVDMAGEMVIAETLVRHDQELAKVRTPRLQRNLAQLTRITAELQKTAMAMRLVPVGPLFRRMARLVRDLSRQFGKQVDMLTEGDDIELDRTIVEELADPLMHMVRNSLDHGIEPAGERAVAGKPATARLLLKAQHQAGQVVLEITDDGRGLDKEKILAKAVQKGLVSAGEELSDNEIYNLIFQPGFTTAVQVTSVSGRGVGMDVVRRHIEKLRGRIEIRSAPGQGATFLLKLPLTLAIIDGLVVGVGQERYIVPLFTVREMFRPKEDSLWTVQQRGEMALVRGSLLPVVRLYRKFGVTPRSEDPMKSVLVVAEVEDQRFCLLVDELIGKQEVVIKSLGETFKDTAGVAGGAILGDGRVGLILDIERIYKDKAGDTGR